MATTDKELREVTARELFMKISYVYTGNASDLGEYDPDKHADKIEDELVPMSDEAVLKHAELTPVDIGDAEKLDDAVFKLEANAERQNMRLSGAREFLQTVSDRYAADNRDTIEHLKATQPRGVARVFAEVKGTGADKNWEMPDDFQILNRLGLDTKAPSSQQALDDAVFKVEHMAKKKDVADAREFVNGVHERAMGFVLARTIAEDVKSYDPRRSAAEQNAQDERVLRIAGLDLDRRPGTEDFAKLNGRLTAAVQVIGADRDEYKHAPQTLTKIRDHLSYVADRRANRLEQQETATREMASAYLDKAEQRRAAAAAESNARLEKLEASRAAERSQKQTQAPRASM